MDYCLREKTVREEIEELDIDENVKERILNKLKMRDNNYDVLEEHLYKRNVELDHLRDAIIAQAKMIGALDFKVQQIKN